MVSKRMLEIEWIVDQYIENELLYLSSSDLNFERDFITHFKREYNNRVWCERIRSAAKKLGLKSKRIYNHDASPSAGIPLFTVVYS